MDIREQLQLYKADNEEICFDNAWIDYSLSFVEECRYFKRDINQSYRNIQ